MNKILMHPTPAGHTAWDATTQRGRELAFLSLFKLLDSQDLYQNMDVVESQLYSQAKNGNARAAEALTLLRKGNEPEQFFEVYVHPTDVPKPVLLTKEPETFSELGAAVYNGKVG